MKVSEYFVFDYREHPIILTSNRKIKISHIPSTHQIVTVDYGIQQGRMVTAPKAVSFHPVSYTHLTLPTILLV